jgi:hypothetical protein
MESKNTGEFHPGIYQPPMKHMYFCHMDVKYGNEDWTEAETVKTFSKERANENFKEVQELRNKNVEVKNLKLCKLDVGVVRIEEEEKQNE